MAKKTIKTDTDDMDAFKQAIGETKPLIHNKVRLTPPNRQIKSKPQFNDHETQFNFSDHASHQEVSGEEFISYKQDSLPEKILRKLRKGQYNVEAILDLHGMTIEKASVAVDYFLQQCLHKGLRVILIIHGKGNHSQMPILKNRLNHWLREPPEVLAFCSAAPTHGSRGALYVLLKNINEGDAK